jgi:hypothetical protein
VQYAVQNVKEYMTALPGDQKLIKKAYGPFSWGYNPELDESPAKLLPLPHPPVRARTDARTNPSA